MDFDARPLPGEDMDLNFPSHLNLEKNLSYPFMVPPRPPSITGGQQNEQNSQMGNNDFDL